MKYITLIFTSFLLSAPFALPGQTTGRVMSLDELFALADTQSKSIKIFESAVTGAEKDISVAKNAYLPTVDFSASATYNGNAWVSDRDFSNGQTFASPHFGNSFSIEASQVIFAGGSIHHQVKALEAQQKIAEWDLAAHRQEVYFLLTGYYLDLYKYRNLLTVYDRNIEQTLQVIRDMRAREAAGVALDNNINVWYVGVGLKFSLGNLYKTPKEVSRLRVSIGQARYQLSSAEEQVTLGVREAYIRYLDSFELLKTQEKSRQLATQNYEVIANRYANDLVLVTDLVDADNLRLSAEVQYVNAQINIIYNYYRLLYAAGAIHPINE